MLISGDGAKRQQRLLNSGENGAQKQKQHLHCTHSVFQNVLKRKKKKPVHSCTQISHLNVVASIHLLIK